MNYIKNFKEYLNEVGFYNPYTEEREQQAKNVSNVEPSMMSDITTGSLYKQKIAYKTPSTEVVKTPNGYSVFALENFRKGDIIEIAPSVLQGSDAYGVMTLKDILFQIDVENGIYALVLGNGSLYAPSNKPNVEYGWNKKTQCMYFVAKQAINRGEELTIDYGDEYWNERIPKGMDDESIETSIEQEPNVDDIGSILSKLFYNKSVRG